MPQNRSGTKRPRQREMEEDGEQEVEEWRVGPVLLAAHFSLPGSGRQAS